MKKKIMFVMLILISIFLIYQNIPTHYVFSNNVCYSCLWEREPDEIVNKINTTLYKYDAPNDYIESDRLLILGRINEDEDLVCKSLEYKKSYLSELEDLESILVLYEELYFLAKECEEDSSYYLDKIIDISHELNKEWKINIYTQIKEGEINRDISQINIEREDNIPENAEKIILGNSTIIIDEERLIGSQIDRFNRDWFSFYIYLFPTETPTPNYNLKYYDINYMDGFLIRKITNYTGAEVIPLPNSNLIQSEKIPYQWYATDEFGNPTFHVFNDKVIYSTNLCDGGVCIFRETHGISSLVPEAIHNNVSLVIGCGDSESKI